MIIVAKFKNREELSNFVKKDLSLPYIDRTNTHVVLITVKEDFGFIDRWVEIMKERKKER